MCIDFLVGRCVGRMGGRCSQYDVMDEIWYFVCVFFCFFFVDCMHACAWHALCFTLKKKKKKWGTQKNANIRCGTSASAWACKRSAARTTGFGYWRRTRSKTCSLPAMTAVWSCSSSRGKGRPTTPMVSGGIRDMWLVDWFVLPSLIGWEGKVGLRRPWWAVGFAICDCLIDYVAHSLIGRRARVSVPVPRYAICWFMFAGWSGRNQRPRAQRAIGWLICLALADWSGYDQCPHATMCDGVIGCFGVCWFVELVAPTPMWLVDGYYGSWLMWTESTQCRRARYAIAWLG